MARISSNRSHSIGNSNKNKKEMALVGRVGERKRWNDREGPCKKSEPEKGGEPNRWPAYANNVILTLDLDTIAHTCVKTLRETYTY